MDISRKPPYPTRVENRLDRCLRVDPRDAATKQQWRTGASGARSATDATDGRPRQAGTDAVLPVGPAVPRPVPAGARDRRAGVEGRLPDERQGAWLHVGDAGKIPVADARRIAQRVAVQVAEGRDPVAERRSARAGNTFAEVAERYATEHAMKRNKSWKQADRLMRKFLLPRWGRLAPSSISRSHVRQMMSAINGPILQNQALSAASPIFSWMVSQDVVSVNPCIGVERNPTASRERVLADDEIKRLWPALDSVGLRCASALRLVLLTGARPGEVAAMRREHIRGKWWELPGAPDPARGWFGTKNGRTHSVFLAPAARAIIDELVDGEPAAGFVLSGDRPTQPQCFAPHPSVQIRARLNKMG